MTNPAKNKIAFYNQDGELMYVWKNVPIEEVKKEITRLKNKYALKWTANIYDYNINKNYSIYFDIDGKLHNNRY